MFLLLDFDSRFTLRANRSTLAWTWRSFSAITRLHQRNFQIITFSNQTQHRASVSITIHNIWFSLLALQF
jgi:hypothetical protein